MLEVGRGEAEGRGLGGVFHFFFFPHFVYALLGFGGVCKHLGGYIWFGFCLKFLEFRSVEH